MRRGVTILPIAIALILILLASMVTLTAILAARARVLERSAHGLASPIERKEAWLRVYVYNVSLCGLLQLWYLAIQNITDSNMTISQLTLDPPRILVLNEGGRAVEIDYLAASALGTIVHERGIRETLEPGEYLAYEPGDLGLPSDYDVLLQALDGVIVHTDRGEAYLEAAAQPPDPISVVSVGEDGSCVEP